MEKYNLIRVITALFLLVASGAASSNSLHKTRVIHDGYGKPTDSYISKVKIGGGGSLKRKSKFPVVTKELSVGRVEHDEAANIRYGAAVRPLFIIGYDAVSVEWLQSNAEILKERNAVGYVANVETEEQLAHLNSIIDNKVLLLAMNASDIANKLEIRHYPFYMDRDGIQR